MKIRLLICFFCLLATMSRSQDKVQSYIDTYKNIAIAEMQRTGVPAAITLAQGLVESGCGEGDLCKTSNNHFGIKCKNEWTGGKVYHDDDSKNECFRSYQSGAESYRDHSDFLKNREPYAFLFKLNPTDYKGWAKGLKKAGYATEKDYPEKLIKIIEDYNLNQYSLLAINGPKLGDDNSALTKQTSGIDLQDSTFKIDTSSVIAVTKDTILGDFNFQTTQPKNITAVIPSEQKKEDSVVIINPNYSSTTVIDTSKPQYPSGVFAINHTKAVYVQDGTSLLSIANQQDIALSKLLDFNDMEDVDVTQSSQLVFLERKQSKGITDVHIVNENETLFDISQKEGVQLDKILEYNKLKKGTFVKVGDKIRLRPIVSFGSTK